MKKNRLIRQWIGFFIIFAGFCVISWPFVTGFLEGKKQDQACEQAIEEMSKLQQAGSQDPAEKDSDSDTESKKNEAKDIKGTVEKTDDVQDEVQNDMYHQNLGNFNFASGSQLESLYYACRDYNLSLIDNKQRGMNSLVSTEYFDLDTRAYGFSDNVIGTLWVPRLGVKLALYLGANVANMARGGAVFGKSSVPMRGMSANTAIAGHRGWSGTPMFRDIQAIQMGDPVYIETPWDRLTYRVCEIKIVPKNDNNWCLIQPGRNLVTLMTCHPYSQNYQRYIVFAELTDEPVPEYEEVRVLMEKTKTEEPRKVVEVDEDGNETIIEIDTSSIDPTGEEYGGNLSNLMILADSRLRIVMYVVGGFTLIIFLWLMSGTIRYCRRRK